MKHLGDITKIDGTKIEPVDCVCFGSPCQDLSVAGKRAGLNGERSGLFMEAVRIIKEMRNATTELCMRGADVSIRPRFAIWENVPGVFYNSGDDFRVVLEELAKVKGKGISIPRCKNKWSKSGFIIGDDFSIAWRLFDAQYWGVPQRRKRIALVVDFDGENAPKILFEQQSLSGDSESVGEAWKGIATDPEGCVTENSFTLKIRGGCEVDSSGKKAGKGALIQSDQSATLGVSQDQTLFK